MKNHLKSIAAPKSWITCRKAGKFMIRPKSGAHPLEMGISLGSIIRDELKLASTLSETRKLIKSNEVLVDGKRRVEYRYTVGLFDVVKITALNKAYRLVLDQKGRIRIKEITAEESGIKICKIVGKTILSGNKIQLNLHDGKNIFSDAKASVGDCLVLTLPDLKIKEILKVGPGAIIYLIRGKHSGDVGKFKEIKDNEVVYFKDGEEIKTAKKYIFVMGKDKSLLDLAI